MNETMFEGKYLLKDQLVDGRHYRGCCRNASVARWVVVNDHVSLFLYWRNKFNDRFIEEISHPEDENMFDVFFPLEETTPSPEQEVSDKLVEEYYR